MENKKKNSRPTGAHRPYDQKDSDRRASQPHSKSHTPRNHGGANDTRFRKEDEVRTQNTENNSDIHGEYENGAVIGRNAVRELLRSNRAIDKLMVQRGERTGSIVVLVAEAIERGIPVIEVEKPKLDAMSGFAPHQGVIALAAEKEYCSVDDILDIAKARGEDPLIVICDGITDPYNLGAIIRCAECCGAHGLIIPKRRAVGLTPLVTKASAGAVEHLAIAKVTSRIVAMSFCEPRS